LEQQRETLAAWYPEFFVLDTQAGCWMISPAVASEIQRSLDRWPRPRWLRFVDITGSAIRVRSAWVKSMQFSSPEIRELWRRFTRERQAEDEGGGSNAPFVW